MLLTKISCKLSEGLKGMLEAKPQRRSRDEEGQVMGQKRVESGYNRGRC